MNEWMNLIKTVTDDIDEWMHEWMNDLIVMINSDSIIQL